MNCVQFHSHVIFVRRTTKPSKSEYWVLFVQWSTYVHTIRATCYQPMLSCVHLHCARVYNGCRAMGEGADVLLSFLCVAVCCWVLAMYVRSFKWLSGWWVWIRSCSAQWCACISAVSKKRGHGRELAQLLNCSMYDGWVTRERETGVRFVRIWQA